MRGNEAEGPGEALIGRAKVLLLLRPRRSTAAKPVAATDAALSSLLLSVRRTGAAVSR